MAPRQRLLAISLLFAAHIANARAPRTPLSVPLTRAGYKEIRRERGVTVYSHPKSDVLHFAAESTFAAPPAAVQAVLLDYQRQAREVDRLSEVRVLKRRPRQLLVYLRLDMPIVSDRDYTLRVDWSKRDDVRQITFRTTPRGPPPRAGVVRMTLDEGSWQLRPVRGGRATFARYQLRMDIAGWIPTWLVRRSAGKELPAVFSQIARMLAKQPPRETRE